LCEQHATLHAPIPIRERWARQIQQIVVQLHDADLVWGNAELENVMIDENYDAWIIGFDRDYHPEGWLYEEKAGTKEGDLHGVAKIVEHLANEPGAV
jgi:hypothetical protein